MTSKSAFHIRPSNFQEVLPIWREKLWPERQSPIEPVSAINSKGEIDVNIMSQEGRFWIAESANGIAGVISGQPTSPTEFRSRGVWVQPEFRASGVGSLLLHSVESFARLSGFEKIWTMPRHTALAFYLKNGFHETSRIERYEYGPHFLVEKSL